MAAGGSDDNSGAAPIFQSLPHSQVVLGGLPVARALPVRGRRMVGPWCFLDRFGPLSFPEKQKLMDVPPHPHIGLQTVTWLLDGEILHDDSLGCEAIATPGGVNVMTAGAGIAHAEQTPLKTSHRLDGVQLWIALPDAHRHIAPSFENIATVPAIEQPGGVVQVFSGTLAGGLRCPASHYSALVGADLELQRGRKLELALDPSWEHAVILLQGDAAAGPGQPLIAGYLHYLNPGRSSLELNSPSGARVLLIGGPPFPEQILMWWNFVARTPEEIAGARAEWEQPHHPRFGEVKAYRGPRLKAPALLRPIAPPKNR